ncbi:MAG: LytTR family DNA-binding domain-containing protein [Lachnospiraceae bacterium]|nr:LytTR family DNA-binding domain-containing protein [Lachnospiraceae bacterium]
MNTTENYTILLLEDNPVQSTQTQAFINEYDSNINILSFSSHTAAENHLKREHPSISLFILDISMGDDVNSLGIEFAKNLSKYADYIDIPIIFITGHPEYMVNAINDIHCFSFLVKPFVKKQLFDQLKMATNRYSFLLRLNNQIQTNVSYSLLLYISSNGRVINYHLQNKTLNSLQYRMKDLENILPSNFIRIHKSYIVNLNYIHNYDFTSYYVTLVNKEILPMGRSYVQEIQNKIGYGK